MCMTHAEIYGTLLRAKEDLSGGASLESWETYYCLKILVQNAICPLVFTAASFTGQDMEVT